MDAGRCDLDAEARRGSFDRTPEGLMNGSLGMKNCHDAGKMGCRLFQHLKPLAAHRAFVARKSRDVAARMGKVGDETLANRIPAPDEPDRTIPHRCFSTASARLLNTMMTSGEKASSSATTVRIC